MKMHNRTILRLWSHTQLLSWLSQLLLVGSRNLQNNITLFYSWTTSNSKYVLGLNSQLIRVPGTGFAQTKTTCNKVNRKHAQPCTLAIATP